MLCCLLIPCLIKNPSTLSLNSLNDSAPKTVAIVPTIIPTPEQLAAVPRRRARPAKARSEANFKMNGEFLCRLIRNNVNAKEDVEKHKILCEIGTISIVKNASINDCYFTINKRFGFCGHFKNQF